MDFQCKAKKVISDSESCYFSKGSGLAHAKVKHADNGKSKVRSKINAKGKHKLNVKGWHK